MAKFCGNCGAASDDNAKMCGNCGAPFAESKNGVGAILSKIPGVNDINIKPEQKELITKIVKIAIPAVAALVVVLIVIFAAIVPNTGAQGAMKKYFKALAKADTATIVEMMPAKYTSDEDEDLGEYLDEYFEYTQEDLEDKYGEYKYKVKDVKAKKLDKDDLEDYQDAYDELVDFSEEYGDGEFEAPKITAGYKIKCDLEIKGDKKDKDGKCTVIMLKENGKWVVYDVSTSVPGADIDF
ncbi:MAG: zinc ribbon domain-containing protein [Clostridia bacterium]|nr:zinc ribbon domain-containing protein [Clostridia bacterium]